MEESKSSHALPETFADLPPLIDNLELLPVVSTVEELTAVLETLDKFSKDSVQITLPPALLEFVGSKKVSLQYMLQQQKLYNNYYMERLFQAKVDGFKCMKKRNRVTWVKKTCEFVAEHYDLEQFILVHQLGCPMDKSTTTAAAKKGKLDILKYAVENKCEWDPKTILTDACESGNLECVKFVKSLGVPWTKSAINKAASLDHLDIVTHSVENNCPWDEETYNLSAKESHHFLFQERFMKKTQNLMKFLDQNPGAINKMANENVIFENHFFKFIDAGPSPKFAASGSKKHRRK